MFTKTAILALAASGALAAPAVEKRQSQSSIGPNAAAKAAGKLYFGTAVDNGDLSNSKYLSIEKSTNDFGQVTPANSMKWDSIEPSRGQFSYSGGDAIVNLATSNGQIMRCHNLVWHNQLPSWVSNGRFDNATLISILQNHIKNEVTHYKGKCYAWDVVNEAVDDSTYKIRTDVFGTTIGPAYIPIAFSTARQYDSAAKLYYNDYAIENPGPKSTAANNLVKMIQAYGAPIDGVGLQSHFISGQTPSTADQVSNMKSFTDLGVDVAITELDIRVKTPETSSELTQQALDYGTTIAACVQTKRCVGVTLWDFGDSVSWVPGTFPGYGAACPWDSNFNVKIPVYNAIVSAFQAGGSSGSSPTSTAPTSTATSAKPSTTTTPVQTSPTGGSCSAHYGQCGGQGWSGPTCCVSGTTCKYSNAYYSQCL